MSSIYCAFVDVGYLRAEGAAQLGLRRTQVVFDADAIITWLRNCLARTAPMHRAYWYEGAYDPRHRHYVTQQHYLDVLAITPGLQLRLGRLRDGSNRLQRPITRALVTTADALNLDPKVLLAEFDKHWTWEPEMVQKGVDTLLTLDLVQLAERRAYTEAVLVAGDQDLVEAVRAAQRAGVRIVLATPSLKSVARELIQVVDDVVVVDRAALEGMLVGRPVAAGVMSR